MFHVNTEVQKAHAQHASAVFSFYTHYLSTFQRFVLERLHSLLERLQDGLDTLDVQVLEDALSGLEGVQSPPQGQVHDSFLGVGNHELRGPPFRRKLFCGHDDLLHLCVLQLELELEVLVGLVADETPGVQVGDALLALLEFEESAQALARAHEKRGLAHGHVVGQLHHVLEDDGGRGVGGRRQNRLLLPLAVVRREEKRRRGQLLHGADLRATMDQREAEEKRHEDRKVENRGCERDLGRSRGRLERRFGAVTHC